MLFATDNQLAVLLDMAWYRCDATEDELRDYAGRFRNMTTAQASDLIETWNQLPVTVPHRSQRPILGPTPSTTPVSPPYTAPTPGQPMPVNARLMPAKFNTTCSECRIPIGVGQQIWYAKGYVATHKDCGPPTHKSGTPLPPLTPIAANVTHTPPPTVPTPAPPTFDCIYCDVTFATPEARDRHYQTVHWAVPGVITGALTVQEAQPKPPLPTKPIPPVVLPELGYYAVEVPINGVGVMRFYRVTERMNKWKNAKIRTFLRQSGDNWVDIEAMERTIAAAIINAAPILAKEAYGKLIGKCGNCGHSLTDEISRARGIGPECIKRFPGRYQ